MVDEGYFRLEFYYYSLNEICNHFLSTQTRAAVFVKIISLYKDIFLSISHFTFSFFYSTKVVHTATIPPRPCDTLTKQMGKKGIRRNVNAIAANEYTKIKGTYNSCRVRPVSIRFSLTLFHLLILSSVHTWTDMTI